MWIAADDQLLVSEDRGESWRPVQVGQSQFIAKVFLVGNSMWALGELGILKQTGNGLQWKRDDTFVPAGAHIASSLDDGSTKGKSN
jgi:photosystem II stability/assembly factor-like uncharacterized protein